MNNTAKEIIEVVLKELLEWIEKNKPFGFIHRTEPINYCGELGLLVWDYIIWNEITFVDQKTKFQQSLYSSFSDKNTEEKFNELVSRYGMQVDK